MNDCAVKPNRGVDPLGMVDWGQTTVFLKIIRTTLPSTPEVKPADQSKVSFIVCL